MSPSASVEMVQVERGDNASASPSSGSRRGASNASRSRRGSRRASISLTDIAEFVPPSPVVDNAADASSSSPLPSSGSPGIEVSDPSESGGGEVELEGGRAASNSVVAGSSTVAVATTGESKGYDMPVSSGNDCGDGDTVENGSVGVPDLAARNEVFFQTRRQEGHMAVAESAREKDAS